jgi:protein SCO1/2
MDRYGKSQSRKAIIDKTNRKILHFLTFLLGHNHIKKMLSRLLRAPVRPRFAALARSKGRISPHVQLLRSPFLPCRHNSGDAKDENIKKETAEAEQEPQQQEQKEGSKQEMTQEQAEDEQWQREKQQREDEQKKQPHGFMSWTNVAVTCAVGAGLIGYYKYEYQNSQRRTKRVESVGKPMVGGPFELIDLNKKVVKSSDFLGQYMLIYFGFSSCPDICPAELRKMQDALHTVREVSLGKTASIRPIFISVDPKRDTPERLREYSKEWDSDIVWLTGTMEQLNPIAKAFRVYYSIPEVGENEEEANDYLVNPGRFL